MLLYFLRALLIPGLIPTCAYINLSYPQHFESADASFKGHRSKSLQVINAGEGVEKREPSCTVGGNVN